MVPQMKRLVLHWLLGGGAAALGFAWAVWRVYVTLP